ncbi:septum formation initiator family protein [Cryobacterium sp. TMT1-21]|uniref:Septum formation initiator family protein n=1 Tax=Cryobacterium shii TaxID=1259235 RepID=A0AAQ2C5I3_9MICO|nr:MULTISPECIES: septum formation initiator family protein [Cryobacterium]TFC45513.1 septum formation initiator family protein [Cryobacterium shii]TFC80928.1 septum formation initiator family protein [Cryobacterium sp. TmT2-59]TFD11383.1 septum formation initiator family protein [Cryobacterium sp. TMT1-21]TFD18799.1 septum formation initiator family protein [Cryobacterium sp. TMT2-23]TFD18878.1 septum formation initiator family protein [Cryobacterium sp. TMT4-10]
MARKRAERRPVALASTDNFADTIAGNWLHGLRLSGFSLVMMGLLIMAVIVLAPGIRTYADQRQQIDRLTAAVTQQQGDVEQLKSERERWNDRTYVTTQARDRLSYVLPGDVSFLVINDLALPVAGEAAVPVASPTIQTTNVDWLSSMFASAMTAGLAPEAAQ